MKCSHHFISTAIVMMAAFAFAGNVCTWQGGSGKFSDDNWDTAPVSGNGDTIVIDTTDGNAVTIENDLADDFEIAKIKFADAAYLPVSADNTIVKPGAVTLTGKRIYFSADKGSVYTVIWNHGSTANEYSRGPEVTVNAPLRFKTGNINISSPHVFNGDIAIDDGCTIWFDWPKDFNYANSGNHPGVTVNGDITGPGASVHSWLGSGGRAKNLELKGNVVLDKCISSVGGNIKTAIRLFGSENNINTVQFQYGYVYFMTEGSISENTVIEHVFDGYGPGSVYFVGNATHTFNLIEATGTRKTKAFITDQGGNNPVLHMKATRDAFFDGYFTKTVSLIYDPQGDYTYTLASESPSTMTGILDIRGGTFKCTVNTSFTAAERIVVGENATLDFSETTNSNPIAASTLVMIKKDGKIVVPAGKTFTIGKLLYRGTAIPQGTYSTADWLEGGSIVVTGELKTWNNTNSGDWSQASNWTPSGTPDVNTEEAFIINEYNNEVIADADEYEFGRLFIGSESSAYTNKFKVSKDAYFKNGTTFTIQQGGVYEQTSGYVSVSNLDNLVKIQNGGIWRIGGGTNVLRSLTSSIGPMEINAGGTVEVTNGVLRLENMRANYPSLYVKGGRIVCSDDGVLDVYNKVNNNYNGIHTHGWGEMVFKDNSRLTGVCLGLSTPGEKLVYRFEDNARFNFEQNLLGGYNKNTSSLIDISSTNKNSRINSRIALGANYSSRTEMIIREKAVGPGLGGPVAIGGYILTAGFDYPANPTGLCPTGIVTVAGSLDYTGASNGEEKMTGLAIGATACDLDLKGSAWSRATTWPHGELNIEPTGIVSNKNYTLAVGVGYGEGYLNIRGGRLVKTAGTSGEFLLGGGEALGYLNITEGGSAEFDVPGYIGGFDPSELGFKWANYPASALTSTGIVSVVDGSLDFLDNTVNVGATGAVTINIGTNGLVKAGDVVLINSVDTTLRFKLCENGGGKIQVAGTLTVGDDVKIEVDAMEIPSKSVVLIDAAQWNGEFEAEDIELKILEPTLGSVRRIGTMMKFFPHTATTVIIK